MNIFHNIYIPIYHTPQINNALIINEKTYNSIILYQKREEIKKNELNKLLKKYLYLQNCEHIDILQHYSLIVKEINQSHVIVSKLSNNTIFLYKVLLNKDYKDIYVEKNFYYEPYESYIPNQDELCLVYTRFQFTKSEIFKLIENNKNFIYTNEKNSTLIDDFNKNNIKDIKLLLQLYVPQLPKHIYYNKYNLNEFMNSIYKRVYNEQNPNHSSLNKFFDQIQKISKFSIFGGIALKYYYKKYNINEKFDFIQSNDYDLNISYLENKINDNIIYCNYVIFMIYNINLFYNKKIIDKNIELNVKDENSPYINMYMTFSEKDDMNIYLWLLSHHTIFKLKSYYSNVLYIHENQTPHIYKAQFISEELNSILTLKYIENSIVNVKSIIKLEVHNNQTEPLEVRVNKNYHLIDFIFRTDINEKFNDYDKNDKVYYNNPIFLMLVYIDLIQKYKNNCITINYRKKLGKEEKDKMRYKFIVHYLLIPFMIEKNDYVLKVMFHLINEDKYKNLLLDKLLIFKCEKNIYNQMDEFYDFLIEKVEMIIHKYFNCEYYRNIKINDYGYHIIKYKKLKKNQKIIENIEVEIENEPYFKINEFLQILYDEKNIEYNIINMYHDRLNKKITSLEHILNKKEVDLNDKISKLMKLYNNFENIKSDYEKVYEKIIKTKYKSKVLYKQECEIIEKIDLINEKMNLIEINVEINNKNLIFKEKLSLIIKKHFKKYKEEEKKIKIIKKAEARKEKERIEELKKIEEEKIKYEQLKKEEILRLERLEKEKELEKIRYQELLIKKRTQESKEKIEKYKKQTYDIILYIPRKTYNCGVYIINKGNIYIHQLGNYLNWIYYNVSFMSILKIVCLLFIIGIICYGKYLHYLDDVKRLELERVRESKVQYSRRFNYQSQNYKQNNYKQNHKKYKL